MKTSYLVTNWTHKTKPNGEIYDRHCTVISSVIQKHIIDYAHDFAYYHFFGRYK